jgi:D-3-phosphoglycerate dehydrogenase / 2-oxoglutarate reductase
VKEPKRKVLIGLYHLADRVAPYVRRLEDAGFAVIVNPHERFYSEDELVSILPGMFATIAGSEPYTALVFQAARELRILARWGVGYDQIDVGAATRSGVIVSLAYGANHEAVADGTLALMLALAENVVSHHLRVKSGGWGFQPHPGLWRSTVGIVGLGRIGKAVARRCLGFETRVLAYDTIPDRTFAETHNIVLVPLEVLLREADFVTLHAPHLPGTENLITQERLALMKPTAFLINTARGGLVDEAALYEALTSGAIAGAGLDTFRREPPIDSPLLTLQNVVLSPHSVGNNLRAEAAVADRCISAIVAVAEGQNPGKEYVLNPTTLRG